MFPFGFGLSYTSYSYSNLTVSSQSVRFTVRNTGARDGAEVAQVYARVPGEPYARLVSWRKVVLKAGESQTISAPIDPMYLSVWDVARHAWALQRGPTWSWLAARPTIRL
jgi:beta-glucosidase